MALCQLFLKLLFVCVRVRVYVCVKGCLYFDQKGAAHVPAVCVSRGCAYDEVTSGLVQPKAAEGDMFVTAY